MRKLNNENFPLINNNKFGYKKDTENDSSISDRLFDRKNKQNDTGRYTNKNENDFLDDNNLIKYKTLKDNKIKEMKYSSKNKKPIKDNKKKDTFNVSYSSDTLGSDFHKLNEDKNQQKKYKDNNALQENEKKPNELDGNNFFLIFFRNGFQ